MFRGNCATLLKVVPQTAVQFAVSVCFASNAKGAIVVQRRLRLHALYLPSTCPAGVIAVSLVCHQVYDTMVEAMLASMAKMELAPGADKHQLSRWQHLTAGEQHTACPDMQHTVYQK